MTHAASTATSFILVFIIGVILFLPGNEGADPAPPKKGFWRARDVLWRFRPLNTTLLNSYRGSLGLAGILAIITILTLHSISPEWLALDYAIIALLLGRASGFWSADRRLRKEIQAGNDA
jgi:hypothetical protein